MINLARNGEHAMEDARELQVVVACQLPLSLHKVLN